MTQVHSADYRSPDDLPEGPALVVGGGNSGFQIAEELAATRPVELSVGSTYPALPQRLLGPRPVLVADPVGPDAGDRRLPARPTRCRPRRDPHRHQPPQPAAGRRPVPAAPGRRRRPHGRGSPTAAAGRSPSSSGRPATGPTTPGSTFPACCATAASTHRRGVTDVPGLYFLGLPWQHTRGSALLGFVADDAAHVVRAVGMRSGQVPEPRNASAGSAPERGGGVQHRATDVGGPGRRTTDTARR